MDDSEFAPGHHPQAYTFATLSHVRAYSITNPAQSFARDLVCLAGSLAACLPD